MHRDGAKQTGTTSATRRAALFVLLTTVLAAAGCGGGGDDETTPSGTGRATLTVRWPDGPSRLVPRAAQSVRIRLTRRNSDTLIGERLLVRPEQGGAVSATFEEAPAADLTATATAYPEATGSGVVMASGEVPVTVIGGQEATAEVALGSTIDHVQLSAPSVALSVGGTAEVTASAIDTGGATVLTAPSDWSWNASNSSIATVSATGEQASLAWHGEGATTVTVTESNSGRSAQLAVQAASPVVYNNDFSDAATVGAEWSKRNTSVTPVGARRFLGEFGPETVRLSLSNLPPHKSITISFKLFILLSWDGNHLPDGPDRFTIAVANGGPTLLDTTFTNMPTYTQSFPDGYLQGDHPQQFGATEVNTLGYYHDPLPTDSVYSLSYTFDHSASSLDIDFTGAATQPIENESWGLDDVQVKVNP